MKIQKYLIALATLVCIVVSAPLNAQTYKEKNENIKNRYESEEFKLINKKIPFSAEDATLAQLSDTSKANKKEKEVIDAWLKILKIYVSDTAKEVYGNQPNIVNIFQEYINSEEAILINLYQGKITYGNANMSLKTLDSEVTKRIKEAKFQNQQAQLLEQQRRQKQNQREEQCNILKNQLRQLIESKDGNNFADSMSDLSLVDRPEALAASRAVREEQKRRRVELIMNYQAEISRSCL